jgi:hypothetical protein
MKKFIVATLCCTILPSCGYGMPRQDTSLKDQLRNPLYAEYYYDDLTEQMINLAVNEHPLMKIEDNKDIVDRIRTRSLEHAALAVKTQENGRIGSFMSDDRWVAGDALLLDGILYLGPSFDAVPGPNQALYLTTTIDPRDGEFPDPTAVKIGGLKNQYGAQTFDVSTLTPASGTGTLRTLVLWDEDLHWIYGFAQLSRVAR